jgi:heme-degrading monooxygenase HmoA
MIATGSITQSLGTNSKGDNLMVYLLMQQEVADYEKWRTVFDSMESVRRSAGARSDRVFRHVDNPNAVTLLIAWDDVESAQNWMGDARLRAALKEAGVMGQPNIFYLNES